MFCLRLLRMFLLSSLLTLTLQMCTTLPVLGDTHDEWKDEEDDEEMEHLRRLPYCPNSFGRDGFEPRWFERDQDNDCIPDLADPNPTKHFNDERR